nr:MAG TPA: hypothetical protein [Caudoviricetes sp.]
MWITPPSAAIPTIRNPQEPVGNSRGAVDYLYAQPLIHRLPTTNPQGCPQGYPHDPAHRVGLESHPGDNQRTPTPPRTPPTQKGPTHHPPQPTHYHGAHAMDHQQQTRTTPKKLEPTQKRNTANNRRKMRRPRNTRVGRRVLGGRPPGHPLRRPPMAPHRLHNTRHRHRPHPTRRFKHSNQPATPVPPMPRLQDHGRSPRNTHTHDTHANTTDTTTSLRQTTKQNENETKRKAKQSKRNSERERRT